ncbi:hypothetical protein O181_009263 [Austropuccinia psidii MF-1]|uniref:Uncharacterized protein n=1 Tax=Austropuccinia psidii MF-1 TaxID=1389203 RepID=A0A9Q3BQS4_9BASI|nr:hypothetical protein [Austropuccinia psidii MF-1]
MILALSTSLFFEDEPTEYALGATHGELPEKFARQFQSLRSGSKVLSGDICQQTTHAHNHGKIPCVPPMYMHRSIGNLLHGHFSTIEGRILALFPSHNSIGPHMLFTKATLRTDQFAWHQPQVYE